MQALQREGSQRPPAPIDQSKPACQQLLHLQDAAVAPQDAAKNMCLCALHCRFSSEGMKCPARLRTCACRAAIFSGVSPLPFLAILSNSGMACSSSVALVLRSSAFSAALRARFFSAAISSARCTQVG